MKKIPTRGELQQYRTNSPGSTEGLTQPLYHYQTYALAGTTTQYTFFQVPVGQSSLTYEDTNMESAGQMPSPKAFLVTGIQLVMLPTVNPSIQGAQAVDAFVNDVYNLGKAGYLKFFVGSRDYLIDGPVGKFTQQFGVVGFSSAADVTTAGAAAQHRTSMGAWRGKYYEITPVVLERNMNFNVTLNFPTTAAVSANIRIGMILDGILYRGG